MKRTACSYICFVLESLEHSLTCHFVKFKKLISRFHSSIGIPSGFTFGRWHQIWDGDYFLTFLTGLVPFSFLLWSKTSTITSMWYCPLNLQTDLCILIFKLVKYMVYYGNRTDPEISRIELIVKFLSCWQIMWPDSWLRKYVWSPYLPVVSTFLPII